MNSKFFVGNMSFDTFVAARGHGVFTASRDDPDGRVAARTVLLNTAADNFGDLQTADLSARTRRAPHERCFNAPSPALGGNNNETKSEY
jgi:hypothetical protein